MPELFDITHDAGNLDEYDLSVIDGGDLSASVAAALAGTVEGLQCIIDDANTLEGRLTFSSSADDFRIRFYLDPNEITIGDGDSFMVLTVVTTGWAGFITFFLGYASGSHRVLIDMYDDGGFFGGDVADITDDVHYIECHVVRSATIGSYQWWIDGVDQGTQSNRDNYDTMGALGILRAGAITDIDAGTEGTFYLDEFKANDDGSEIGEVNARSAWDAAKMRKGVG